MAMNVMVYYCKLVYQCTFDCIPQWLNIEDWHFICFTVCFHDYVEEITDTVYEHRQSCFSYTNILLNI